MYLGVIGAYVYVSEMLQFALRFYMDEGIQFSIMSHSQASFCLLSLRIQFPFKYLDQPLLFHYCHVWKKLHVISMEFLFT